MNGDFRDYREGFQHFLGLMVAECLLRSVITIHTKPNFSMNI